MIEPQPLCTRCQHYHVPLSGRDCLDLPHPWKTEAELVVQVRDLTLRAEGYRVEARDLSQRLAGAIELLRDCLHVTTTAPGYFLFLARIREFLNDQDHTEARHDHPA